MCVCVVVYVGSFAVGGENARNAGCQSSSLQEEEEDDEDGAWIFGLWRAPINKSGSDWSMRSFCSQ